MWVIYLTEARQLYFEYTSVQLWRANVPEKRNENEYKTMETILVQHVNDERFINISEASVIKALYN